MESIENVRNVNNCRNRQDVFEMKNGIMSYVNGEESKLNGKWSMWHVHEKKNDLKVDINRVETAAKDEKKEKGWAESWHKPRRNCS